MLRIINRSRYESFTVILYFCVSPISKFLELFGVSRILTYLVMLSFFLYYVIWNLNKCTVDIVLFYGICTPLLIYGVIKNGLYINSRTNIYAIFINFFLAYYMFRVSDLDHLLDSMRKAAYFVLLYYYIEAFMTSFNSDDYMSYAYHIQFFLCVVFYYALNEKKIVDIFLFLVGVFTMFFFGARGALIGLLFFVVYILLQRITKITIVLGLGCVCLATLLMVNAKELLNILGSIGVSSRTLEKIVSGQFFISTSRNNLYSICLSLIKANPFGYGILTSRRLIKYYVYPHSLLFELQLDFGVGVGSVIFISIVLIVIYLLVKKRSMKYKTISALFCILGMVMLMVSSSLYYEYYIPAIIAIFFNELGRRKRRLSTA